MAQVQNTKTPGMQSGSTALPDPIALMRIKSLQLRAKMVVEGFYHGLHKSPFHGNSVEFREYRPYSYGDDLRNLDWKLYARSDRYYIKKFDDETNRFCTLIYDRSRSMDYGSLEYTKSEYAATVLATLAYYLTGQRDHVGLLTFDDEIRDYLPPRGVHGQLRRLMSGLVRAAGGRDTNMVRPLQEIAAVAKRRGLIILASDFLTPVESLRGGLSLLRARGHQVILLRILDPAEMSFSVQTPSMIRDMETGRDLYVDPALARQQYQDSFQQHQSDLYELCNGLGVDLFPLLTNESVEGVLHEFVTRPNRKGSQRSASYSTPQGSKRSEGGSA